MKHLTLTAAAMLLAACSVPPESGKSASQPLNKETVKMSENKTPSEMQKEILTNLLEMMKTSTSVKDFTPKNLEQAFNIKMRADESEADSYFFSKELTENWWWGLNKYKTPLGKQDSFRLSFGATEKFRSNHEPHETPDIGEICGMGFDEFVQEAEKLGFTQEPDIVQDGMQIGVYLTKGNLQVNVLHLFYRPKDNPSEKTACIRMILIG